MIFQQDFGRSTHVCILGENALHEPTVCLYFCFRLDVYVVGERRGEGGL